MSAIGSLSTGAAAGWVARLNVLRWHWRQHWGWPGLIALLLLLASAVLAWQIKPGYERDEQELLRAKVRQLSALARLKSAQSAAVQRDPRDEARDSLPSLDQRGAQVRAVLRHVEASGMAIGRVDYVVQAQEPALQRLRITLPLTGSYAQLRRLIGRLLNQMPQTALDGLQIDRPPEQPEVIDATVRLSVFFRAEVAP